VLEIDEDFTMKMVLLVTDNANELFEGLSQTVNSNTARLDVIEPQVSDNSTAIAALQAQSTTLGTFNLKYVNGASITSPFTQNPAREFTIEFDSIYPSEVYVGLGED
jgi:hypothetical protein